MPPYTRRIRFTAEASAARCAAGYPHAPVRQTARPCARGPGTDVDRRGFCRDAYRAPVFFARRPALTAADPAGAPVPAGGARRGHFRPTGLRCRAEKLSGEGAGWFAGGIGSSQGCFLPKRRKLPQQMPEPQIAKKTGKAGPAWISGRRRFGELYLPASPLRIPPAASRTFRAFARASSTSRSASRHMRDAYIMVARSSAPEPAPLMASLPTPHR